jgi:hypothetical protein
MKLKKEDVLRQLRAKLLNEKKMGIANKVREHKLAIENTQRSIEREERDLKSDKEKLKALKATKPDTGDINDYYLMRIANITAQIAFVEAIEGDFIDTKNAGITELIKHAF